jgi:hypothetical protein
MNKQEATELLKEIYAAWEKETPIHGYSIDKTPAGYVIRIILPAFLSSPCQAFIVPITAKHGLSLEESNGALVVLDQRP